MKKILTIDFDIIMWPMINSYNSLVPQQRIETLNIQPIINYQVYTDLTNLLLLQDTTNIHFIISHDQLVSYINEPVELINIDHHHDLGYRQNDDLDCSNWVRYLFEKNLIKSYTWIHNINEKEIFFYYPVIEKIIQDIVCIYQEIKQADEIFICLSPEWIPPQIRTLYDLWINLMQKKINKNIKVEFPQKKFKKGEQ